MATPSTPVPVPDATKTATVTDAAGGTSSATTTSAVKPGWATTEHLIAFLVAMLGTLMTSGIIADGSTAARIGGAVMAAFATLGYSYSRGMVKAGAILLFFVLATSSSSMGCTTASARQTTINTTLSGINVVSDTFKAWDTEHQKEIIAKATSEADGAAKLAAYRVTQGKIVAAIGAAYSALAAAQTLNDSHTLSAALVAFAQAQAAWDDLKRTGAAGAVSP